MVDQHFAQDIMHRHIPGEGDCDIAQHHISNNTNIMGSNWAINRQTPNSNGIRLNEEAASSKPAKETSQIDECSPKDSRSTKAHDEHGEDKNNLLGIDEHQVPAPSRYGWTSPTRQVPTDDASSGKSCTPSPTSISHNTLVLAQLYHASRRSRHSPCNRSGTLCDVTPSKPIPPLPLTYSSSEGSHQTSIEMDDTNENPQVETRRVHFASTNSAERGDARPGSKAISASELFGEAIMERESKRMKTSMNKK